MVKGGYRVVTGGYGWLRVITGGYGCFWLVMGGSGLETSGYQWLLVDLQWITNIEKGGIGRGSVSSRSFDLLNSMIY